MSKTYTIEKDWENIPHEHELLGSDKLEMEITEQEVIDLAKQLPKKAIEEVVLENKGYWKQNDNFWNTELDYCGECKISKSLCTHSKEPSKVSDCCGAGVERKTVAVSRYGVGLQENTCKSCGEPCEAMEEKENCRWCRKQRNGLDVPCRKHDTKPDTIEPIESLVEAYYADEPELDIEMNRNKINEIINYLNNK